MKGKSLISIALRFSVSFFSFYLTYLISHTLTVKESSLFFLFLSFQSVALVIFTFGSNDYIVKQVSSNYGRANEEFFSFLLSTLTIVFIFSSLVCVFVYAYIKFIAKVTIGYDIGYILFSFVFLSIANVVSSFFQAKGLVNYSILSLSLFPFLFCFSLILTGFEIFNNVSKLYFLSSVFSVLLCFVAFYMRLKPVGDRVINFGFFKSKELLYIFSIQLIFQLFAQSVIILMPLLGFANDVAFVSVALKVLSLVSLVILTMNKVISHDVAFYYSQSNFELLISKLRYSSRLILLICCPILLIVFIFAKDIMIFFGNEYLHYYSVLRILVLGQIVNVLTGNVGMLLTMAGFSVYLQRSMLLGLFISIVCSCVFIPLLGVVGAAWSVTFSISAINLLSSYYVYRYLKINMFKLVL